MDLFPTIDRAQPTSRNAPHNNPQTVPHTTFSFSCSRSRSSSPSSGSSRILEVRANAVPNTAHAIRQVARSIPSELVTSSSSTSRSTPSPVPLAMAPANTHAAASRARRDKARLARSPVFHASVGASGRHGSISFVQTNRKQASSSSSVSRFRKSDKNPACFANSARDPEISSSAWSGVSGRARESCASNPESAVKNRDLAVIDREISRCSAVVQVHHSDRDQPKWNKLGTGSPPPITTLIFCKTPEIPPR